MKCIPVIHYYSVSTGYPTDGPVLSRGQIAGTVIGVLISISVSVYVCVQFEKLKKAKQAVANQARGRQPLVPRSQTNDSHPESEPTVAEVADPELTISQFSDPDLESQLGLPAPERQPSFPVVIEPSAPALSKTPPPSFEEAVKYPTLSLELEPPPPYPGFPVSEVQPYPINNPTNQPSNY